jgi:hypothetical protein
MTLQQNLKSLSFVAYSAPFPIDLLLAFPFIKFWGRPDAYPTRKNDFCGMGRIARPVLFLQEI